MALRAAIPLALAILVGLGFGLFGLWRGLRQARLLKITEDLTRTHARLLLVKQRQLVSHDGYGNYRLDAWIDHANYFIDNVIVREVRNLGLDTSAIAPDGALRNRITKRFLRVLHQEGDSGRSDLPEAAILSGEDYETFCLTRLEAAGWVVATTPMTGDQGADLIAEAAGQRVVIQCKFHAKAIGNKAVQEAFAAKAYHAGHHAAVVSNRAFTRSAQQLAEVNGVLLLHHDQLPDLARMIGFARPSADSRPRPPRRTGGRTT